MHTANIGIPGNIRFPKRKWKVVSNCAWSANAQQFETFFMRVYVSKVDGGETIPRISHNTIEMFEIRASKHFQDSI